LNIQISQGSAATDLRAWGCGKNTVFFCSLSATATMKE